MSVLLRSLVLLLAILPSTSLSANKYKILDQVGGAGNIYWACHALTYSPDGATLASVCGMKRRLSLVIFDSRTGEKIKEASFPEIDLSNYKHTFRGYFGSLDFSPDGRLIAFTSFALVQRPIVWESETLSRKELPGMSENGEIVETALAFSPDSHMIAVGDSAGRISIFDIATGSRISLIEDPDSDSITALLFSPDGDLLLSAIQTLEYTAVRIWDWSSGQEWATLKHGSLVTDIIVNENTRQLYTLAGGSEVRVWEIPSGTQEAEGGIEPTKMERAMPTLLSVLCGAAMAVNFNPATFGSCFAATGGKRKRANVAMPRMALSPDGRNLVIVNNRATRGMGHDQIVMFDATTLEKLSKRKATRRGFDMGFGALHDVAYSPDGNTIAVAGGGIRLFDATTGEERIPSGVSGQK